jgi:SWI/SNF-related matrix-associated actin-dependent regulator 1 of chromatin subfamily A
MIRRLKSDVLSELPPKKRSVINLEIAQKDMIDYKQKVEEKAEKMELYGTTAAVKVSRVQQYIKTHLIPTKQKCLIFAHHRVMLNAIEETISSSNCGYIRIDGTTPMETRHEKSINFRNE